MRGNGAPFYFLSTSFPTEKEVREDLKNYPEHPSAFVAREITEVIAPIRGKQPTRRKAV